MKYKENLFLIHSFPTNSILLKGLVEYLDDHINLFFIDLPGFTNDVAPLDTVTLDTYSDYVKEKIDESGVESYLIGGISFGFIVANNVDVSDRCKAICAIEPYINNRYLSDNFLKRFFYTHLLDEIIRRDLSKDIWENELTENTLSFLSGQPSERIHVVLQEMDDSTFFHTAKLLIEHDNEVSFHKDIPYVLLINKNDETIKAAEIVDLFVERVDKLLLKYTDIDHYPEDVSKEYFEKNLPPRLLEEIIGWVNIFQ